MTQHPAMQEAPASPTGAPATQRPARSPRTLWQVPQAQPPRLRVLVSVPNEMVRCGLSTMLLDAPSVGDVQGCGDLKVATRLLVSRQFDVLVLSPLPCPEAAERLAVLASERGTKPLLLLHSPDEQLLSRAASMPVAGFLHENDLTRASLEDALCQLARGELPMPSSLARRLLARLRRFEAAHAHGDRSFLLTPREQQVLQLLAEGLSNKQIARRLGISEHGAKRHVANVLAKLNCPNRTLAVAMALRYDLVSQPDEGSPT